MIDRSEGFRSPAGQLIFPLKKRLFSLDSLSLRDHSGFVTSIYENHLGRHHDQYQNSGRKGHEIIRLYATGASSGKKPKSIRLALRQLSD